MTEYEKDYDLGRYYLTLYMGQWTWPTLPGPSDWGGLPEATWLILWSGPAMCILLATYYNTHASCACCAGYLPEIIWLTVCVIITEIAHSVPDFVCDNGPGWSCLLYRTEGHTQRHPTCTMSCDINIILGAGIFLVNPNHRLKNCKTVYQWVTELVRCFIIDFGSEEMELCISLIVNWAICIIDTLFIMDPH